MVPIDIYETLIKEIESLLNSIKAGQIKSHYGTSEGVMKAWDTRGRGRKEKEKESSKSDMDLLQDEKNREVLGKIVSQYQKEYVVSGKPEQGDVRMEMLAQAQGFDAKPQVVDENALEKYASENNVPILYRGVTNQQYAEEFKDGKYWAGKGLLSNGTYTAYDPTTIEKRGVESTGKNVASQYTGQNGTIMKMCLDKDAKIVNYEDLEKEMAAWHREYQETGKDFNYRVSNMLSDPGKFAMAKGYDAIDVRNEEMKNWGMMIILNRGKVKVVK